MPSLAQLRIFLAVINTGSFTAAADAIGLSQSAVSHSVASLERELGIALFARERAGAVAIPPAERIADHARKMLTLEEAIGREADGVRGAERGRVRLGTFPSVSTRVLPGLLGGMRLRHPGIEVIPLTGTDDEVRGWIAAGTVDVGVVTLPARGMDTLPLAVDAYIALVPTAHPLAIRASVRVAELAGEPFVMGQPECERVVAAMFRRACAAPRQRVVALDVATMLAMVQEGLGVTIVPEFAVPANVSGVSALPLDPPERRHLALAVRSLAAAAPVVRSFLRHAEEWARSRGTLDTRP